MEVPWGSCRKMVAITSNTCQFSKMCSLVLCVCVADLRVCYQEIDPEVGDLLGVVRSCCQWVEQQSSFTLQERQEEEVHASCRALGRSENKMKMKKIRHCLGEKC